MASVEISEPFLDETDKVNEDGSEETVPDWKDQITLRGLFVSALLGTLFCIITHKLNLTVGIIPSLNVAAGLLGFFFLKSWTTLLSRLGLSVRPFTKQENTVIQTCVVACYGLAFSGNLIHSKFLLPFSFSYLPSFFPLCYCYLLALSYFSYILYVFWGWETVGMFFSPCFDSFHYNVYLV